MKKGLTSLMSAPFTLRRERDIFEPLIPYLRVSLTIILSFRTPLNEPTEKVRNVKWVNS